MSLRPKILMLIDRTPGQPLGTEAAFGISYSITPDPTDLYFFSLSHLLSTLQADVTKAHRQTDPAADHGAPTPADIENFRFTTAGLSAVDEVWLIGYNSTRADGLNLNSAEKASFLDDKELDVLATFMDAGGGVYATGDHAGLGASLAARVPRVRSMRKWWYPSPGPHGEPVAPPPLSTGTDSRIDTTQYGNSGPPTPAGTTGVWFDAQSDDIPVYISPEQTTNLCYEPSRYILNPNLLHPLLQGPNGPILGFADHMHEGEAVLPYEYDRVLTYNGTKFTEYPAGPSGVVHPQIIAWGFTNGAISVVPATETGAHVGDARPSMYRSYGVVGAYDGRVAGVGRVVVDSTFHHFMDINLVGDPVAPQGDPKQVGFRTGQGGPILAGIEAFFNNVAQWLSPPKLQIKIWVSVVYEALRNQIVREGALYDLPDRVQELGAAAVDSVRHQIRHGMLVDHLLSTLPRDAFAQLTTLPWGPVTGTAGCGSVDHSQLTHAAMGHALQAAVQTTKLRDDGSSMDEREAEEYILAATIAGLASTSHDLTRRGKSMLDVAEALTRAATRAPASQSRHGTAQ